MRLERERLSPHCFCMFTFFPCKLLVCLIYSNTDAYSCSRPGGEFVTLCIVPLVSRYVGGIILNHESYLSTLGLQSLGLSFSRISPHNYRKVNIREYKTSLRYARYLFYSAAEGLEANLDTVRICSC